MANVTVTDSAPIEWVVTCRNDAGTQVHRRFATEADARAEVAALAARGEAAWLFEVEGKDWTNRGANYDLMPPTAGAATETTGVADTRRCRTCEGVLMGFELLGTVCNDCLDIGADPAATGGHDPLTCDRLPCRDCDEVEARRRATVAAVAWGHPDGAVDPALVDLDADCWLLERGVA